MEKKTLRFREDGTFKILQLTDMHLYDDGKFDEPAITGALELISREAPDLVAFTGDISCDGSHEACGNRLDSFLSRVDALGVPYTYTLGNHESDTSEAGELGRQHVIADVLSRHALSLFEKGDGALGVGNYVIPVYSRDGARRAWALYHLDCHSGVKYPFTPGELTRRDAYISRAQRAWLEDTHLALREAEGGAVPAILFDHVPPAEFDDVWLFDGVWGDHGEMICRAPIGDGLVGLLRELEDFRGIFVGHDHTNSFQGNYMGLTLAYGRCSGNFRWALWTSPHGLQTEAKRHPAEGETPYTDHFVRGGRVIMLTEEGGMDTWVSLYNGESGIGKFTPPLFNRFNFFIPVDGQQGDPNGIVP